MTAKGGTDTDVFEAFVELVRKPQTGDIVVLDNVGGHKPTRIRALVKAAGARLLFLPPYSPHLNPIELGWSKGHEGLRCQDLRRARCSNPEKHRPHRCRRR